MSAQRREIEFQSHGATCRGFHYPARGVEGPAPVVVMSHGFSAVAAMGLDAFAERFADAGLNVLIFDYRHLGSSDGVDRGRIMPQEQHDDLRAAIGFAAALPGVDPERTGLWGSSYSGGHALFVGALDPRVKAISVQAPAIDLVGSLQHMAGAEGFRALLALLSQDHAARAGGHKGGRLAIVAPDGEPCLFPGAEARDWFMAEARSPGARWENDTSLESVARLAEYQPAAFIHLIAPRPLQVLAGSADSLIPLAQIEAAMARAGQPNRLETFDGGHFDFYRGGKHHAAALDRAANWFTRHLAGDANQAAA